MWEGGGEGIGKGGGGAKEWKIKKPKFWTTVKKICRPLGENYLCSDHSSQRENLQKINLQSSDSRGKGSFFPPDRCIFLPLTGLKSRWD